MADNFYDLFKEFKDKTTSGSFNIKEYIPAIPEEITNFLGQLSLLKNVPYHYLVPNENYLPKFRESSTAQTKEKQERNSIKFFLLDPLWVQSLLNGALSMCDKDALSKLLSKAMAGNYAADVLQKEMIERYKKQLFGSYNADEIGPEIIKRMADKGINVTNLSEPASPTPAQMSWRYTGFFFRSALVSSWKGLEVEAEGINKPDDTTAPRKLGIVRMETIAPDTLFCLCEGIITRVLITQPSENLHFGVEGNYDTKAFEVQKNDDTKVAVPLRGGGNRRTIDINGLVENMQGSSAKYSSADFAIDMVARPIKNTIKMNWVENEINRS